MSDLVQSHMPPRSVYVHVPFCAHRCGYCDFTVIAGRDDLIPQWLQALNNEMSAICRADAPIEVDTIFLGGGTPTHLPPAALHEMLSAVRSHFSLSDGGELSVEANPEDLSPERLEVLCRHGVNRLSLGVQSFDNDCLRVLERSHTAESAIRSIQHAARVIPNTCVDLIFAVPGQTAESWDATLQTAMSLPVRHLSTYGLTWETGTSFIARARRGELIKAPEELERDMYLRAIDSLTAAGFEHYEVSNFARPGFRSRHNSVYWNADEYFACGPGASRYVARERSTNTRSVLQWISAWSRHQPCLADSERLSDQDRAREAVMLGLRLREGVDLPRFETRFGVSIPDLAPDALARHAGAGHLTVTNDRLRLTTEGLLIADTVIADFL